MSDGALLGWIWFIFWLLFVYSEFLAMVTFVVGLSFVHLSVSWALPPLPWSSGFRFLSSCQACFGNVVLLALGNKQSEWVFDG